MPLGSQPFEQVPEAATLCLPQFWSLVSSENYLSKDYHLPLLLTLKLWLCLKEQSVILKLVARHACGRGS